MLIYLYIGNISKKIMNIQLQNLFFSDMGKCIFSERNSTDVSTGAFGYGQLGQNPA